MLTEVEVAPCNSFDSNTRNSCNSFDSNTRNSCNSFDSQPEVAEDSELSDSEVQCAVCEPEEQSLHTVLVAEVAGLVAYGLESRLATEGFFLSLACILYLSSKYMR